MRTLRTVKCKNGYITLTVGEGRLVLILSKKREGLSNAVIESIDLNLAADVWPLIAALKDAISMTNTDDLLEWSQKAHSLLSQMAGDNADAQALLSAVPDYVLPWSEE